jgi:hypothetical protein
MGGRDRRCFQAFLTLAFVVAEPLVFLVVQERGFVPMLLVSGFVLAITPSIFDLSPVSLLPSVRS